MKYALIQSLCGEYTAARLLSALDVSPSGYYAWRNRPESDRKKTNCALTTKILAFHRASRTIYGSPWIHEDLVESGEKVGVNRVARLMRISGIQSKMA